MTETVTDKVARLLATESVQIRWATDQIISAAVRGDGGPIYDIRWTRNLGWSCTCQCMGRCSHEEAVASVTMRSVAVEVK
jgi:hypothetical protein